MKIKKVSRYYQIIKCSKLEAHESFFVISNQDLAIPICKDYIPKKSTRNNIVRKSPPIWDSFWQTHNSKVTTILKIFIDDFSALDLRVLDEH